MRRAQSFGCLVMRQTGSLVLLAIILACSSSAQSSQRYAPSFATDAVYVY